MSVAARSRLREIATFLAVGGAGYVVDVGVFSLLILTPPFSRWDPTVARVAAVAAAMVVTFIGNTAITWRGSHPSWRQIGAFVVLNVVGLGPSLLCLWISHDRLGLTSPLDDNLSANGVGLLLGTAIRYFSYRWWVFRPDRASEPRTEQSGGSQVDGAMVAP